MDNLLTIANRSMRNANMGKTLAFPDGRTSDIITEILAIDKISKNDTAKFATALKGRTVDETLSNVWHFLKTHISYKLDPVGFQFVKTPSRTWVDKYADCKSFSIFVASLLKNLNIPFRYRFVSFVNGGDYTHVYVVVPLPGQTIIMDVVMPTYNSEKPFEHNKDFDMTKIYRLSGIGEQPLKTKIIDLGTKDIGSITDGEMDLLIARDRLKTEKAIVEQKRGIGSLIGEKYQDSIDMINDALEAVNGFGIGAISDIEKELDLIADDAVNGVYSNSEEIAGIGEIGAKAKRRAVKKVQRAQARITKSTAAKPTQNVLETPKGAPKKKKKGKTKTGKFLKKVGKAVKKGVKAVVKVSTLPMRLAAKAILEVMLPKAAPFFLYLFITDPKVLEKLPAKVKAKREKSEKIANFIINGIGMKRTHFMGIVRIGIMKQYKKSPENVLADLIKNNIAGIGFISVAVVTAAISIIKKLSTLLKKKTESVSKNDAPDPSDFGQLGTDLKNSIAREIKIQPENSSALSTDSENPDQPLSPAIRAKQQALESQYNESGEVLTTGAYTTTANSFESGGKSVWNSLSS